MDETKRLTFLVNDMLDLSMLEAGSAKLNKVKYNLTDSLQQTINRISSLVQNESYQLVFEYEDAVNVVADEVKLTQAFYNLLLNAITYSWDDKRVIVRQIIKENTVKIEVIDHGEGIKQNDLPYIWERYYKVDKQHKRPLMGTGFGLAIVRKVIEMHGGKYGVEFAEGKGSTFWFQIELK